MYYHYYYVEMRLAGALAVKIVATLFFAKFLEIFFDERN